MPSKWSSPRTITRTILIGVGVLLLLAAGAWALRGEDKHEQVGLIPAGPQRGVTPVITAAPQFSFPDQDDQPITTQSLKGKARIADFIFTSCGNVCPRMTAQRVELQKKIADPRVMFLSFSVDPEHDTRATRKSYAAEKKVDEARWKFISPPDRETALKIAQAMKVAAPGKPHDAILHSDRFILIDANAQVRGSYLLDDPASMERLITDATALAGQATK